MTASSGICHVEEVMGTRVTIDVRDDPGRHALAAVISGLHDADRTFSLYQEGSWLSRLRRGEVAVDTCPPAVGDVLVLALECQELTGGAFDLSWRGDGLVDPTGLVKGWAAQQASDVLASYGLTNHMVNAAGDVRVLGEASPGRSWAVGIAHPLHAGRLVAVVEGDDLAVATSGMAEKGHHVIDPRTGEPATAAASVTVVGPDLARADAFATAGVAAGDDAVDLLDDLDGRGWASLLVHADGRVWASTHFKGRIADDGLLVQPRPT